MDYLATLDGAMSVNDTQRACIREQNAGFQLESIQFGTKVKDGNTFLVNKAAFDLKTLGRLPNLLFVEVSGDKEAETVRKTKTGEGWTFICDSQIYVNDSLSRVVVFAN